MDLFPTFARIVGGKVPQDRIIDGVDQLDYFLGKKENSNRESVVIYNGNDIYGVKWRNWKMMTKEIASGYGEPVKEYPVPLFYDLYTDPKEEHPDIALLKIPGCAGRPARSLLNTPHR